MNSVEKVESEVGTWFLHWWWCLPCVWKVVNPIPRKNSGGDKWLQFSCCFLFRILWCILLTLVGAKRLMECDHYTIHNMVPSNQPNVLYVVPRLGTQKVFVAPRGNYWRRLDRCWVVFSRTWKYWKCLLLGEVTFHCSLLILKWREVTNKM